MALSWTEGLLNVTLTKRSGSGSHEDSGRNLELEQDERGLGLHKRELADLKEILMGHTLKSKSLRGLEKLVVVKKMYTFTVWENFEIFTISFKTSVPILIIVTSNCTEEQ